MSEPAGGAAGSHSFFAAWLLLHEKADDWLRDAMRRARETPEESRKEYQRFLLDVDREKEALKSVFAEAMVHELRHLGFVHRDDRDDLRAEMESLRERLRGLEDRMELLRDRG